MSRNIRSVLALTFVLVFCGTLVQAFETDFHGRVQSTYVLRDTNGFQHGFMDNTSCAQWRNELKIDLSLFPEYETEHMISIYKFFINYRGAYDAVFDVTDRWDDVRDKSPADFEYGKDDIQFENDLREAFVDIEGVFGSQITSLRLGRQIVQWGEADGFNVMNIINPQDNRVMMFFETPDDLATPLWMGRLNHNVGSLGFLDNVGVEFVATPDIRPHMFSVMDDDMNAPYAFGFRQLKARPLDFIDTRTGQFADLGDVLVGAGMLPANPFAGFRGVTTINGLEDVAFPVLDQTLAPGINQTLQWHDNSASSGVEHLEYGGKFTASYGDFIGYLYYFRGYQDDGVMNFSEFFTKGNLTFDHPKQNYIGASFNMFLAPINAVFRGEGNLVDEVAILDLENCWGGQGDTVHLYQDVLGIPEGHGFLNGPENAKGYTMHKVYQGLLGLDIDRFVYWLNPTSMIKTSWQIYWKHIDDWDYDKTWRPFDEEDNYRATLFVWTDYMNGKIHPEMFVMYDFENVWMTMMSVKYSRDGKFFTKLTQMSFWGDSDAISPFTQPVNLINTSELSIRFGYQW